MTRLFLDTNIVIDLLDKREPFCADAVRLFSLAHKDAVKLFVAPITYATASYLLQKNRTPQEVRSLLYNFRQLSHVATIDERVIDDAIASSFRDFEDAVQYYAALKVKADYIITRNGKDFEFSKIPVMTAAEYLAL